MDQFERDTYLEAVGENRFRGSLDRGRWIVKGPNGGYLAAILLRSMLMTVNQPERAARSLTVHYLSVPEDGPIEVATTVEKSGRSLTAITARMTQGRKIVALATGALGAPLSGIDFQDVSMPEVGLPESYPSMDSQGLVPNVERFEMRPAFGGELWSGSERALTGGWIRPKDQRPMDALLMAALVDAWFPSIFVKATDGRFAGAVPTVDLMIFFRVELPLADSRTDDYYLVRFESTAARHGYMEESGEIWSSSGLLLAQSHQLALLYWPGNISQG
jgi:acyl-CoA thioesterase